MSPNDPNQQSRAPAARRADGPPYWRPIEAPRGPGRWLWLRTGDACYGLAPPGVAFGADDSEAPEAWRCRFWSDDDLRQTQTTSVVSVAEAVSLVGPELADWIIRVTRRHLCLRYAAVTVLGPGQEPYARRTLTAALDDYARLRQQLLATAGDADVPPSVTVDGSTDPVLAGPRRPRRLIHGHGRGGR